ncbi:EamA family transporter [Halalkalibaculum roseum]|uniref:EamA family transporter n=1 Tax=Halalkalibaculum roseum TaxID=2709311 RepID=UPI002011AADD|nr:EamA family transporter [Halalkalibaculum roseum]
MAYVLVVIGASLWGIIGIFIHELSNAGFTSLQIVTLRVVSAAIMLVSYLLISDAQLLKINMKDTPVFAGTGIMSIVFFNWCYFTAIQEVSLSIAVMLLYTGPAFVILLSRIFFKEYFNYPKIIALLFTAVGCMLVIQLFPLSNKTISFYGVLVGLGSGFGYALYSIFGKVALRKHPPITIITYTFVFASLALLPTSGLTLDSTLLFSPNILITILGLGLFPTVLAYLLYTIGLSMIESGKASITATMEPVIATALGVFMFNEVLTGFQIVGIFLIISAVIILQIKGKKRKTVARTP